MYPSLIVVCIYASQWLILQVSLHKLGDDHLNGAANLIAAAKLHCGVFAAPYMRVMSPISESCLLYVSHVSYM
jgi:hypothetical protein